MHHRIPSLLGAVALWLLACCAVPAQGSGSWTWPVRGEVVTPYRNGSDPYASGQHRGVDLAAPVGARVVSATAGTVRFAGVAGSSGLTVSVRTADGRFDTSYLHLATAAVRSGDRVSAGEGVGTVGTSGRRSAAQPHLHFGVREAGSRHAYRNPLEFLPPLPPVPTPDAPRGAPLPVGAPVHTAPAPVRVPGPARGGSPRRLPARRPLRMPLPGRSVRVPAGPGWARRPPAACRSRRPARSQARRAEQSEESPMGPCHPMAYRRPGSARTGPRQLRPTRERATRAPRAPRLTRKAGRTSAGRWRAWASWRRLGASGSARAATRRGGGARSCGRLSGRCWPVAASSIGRRALLRDHADLLRQRRAPPRPRVHDRGADVLARHMRQRGEDVFFLTGTDEHGEPVAQAAEAQGRRRANWPIGTPRGSRRSRRA